MILRDNGGRTLEEWMSGETPHEIAGKLTAGESYTLHEEAVPDGYAYASDVTFAVSLDGRIDRVVFEDRPTQVQVHKTAGGDGSLLGGSLLKILDEDGKTVEKWTSREGEVHVITGKLIAGKIYILREEKAPAGYRKAEDIRFVVSKDGTPDHVYMEDLRRPDEPTPETVPEIAIKKYDSELRTPLAGAEFTIYDENGREYLKVVSNVLGRAAFLRPEAGSYTYRETKAPEGYVCSDKVYDFTVTDSGKTKGTFAVYDEKTTKPEVKSGTIDASYRTDGPWGGKVTLREKPRLRIQPPKTGDSGRMFLDLFLFLANAAGLVFVLRRLRKIKHEKRGGDDADRK